MSQNSRIEAWMQAGSPNLPSLSSFHALSIAGVTEMLLWDILNYSCLNKKSLHDRYAHMQRPRQNEFVFDLFLASCAFSGVFRALSVDCWKALSNWLEVFVGGNLSTFGDHSCRWIRIETLLETGPYIWLEDEVHNKIDVYLKFCRDTFVKFDLSWIYFFRHHIIHRDFPSIPERKAPLIDAITACNPRTSLSECIIRRLASGVSPLATSVFQVWKSALTNSQKTDYLMDLCEIDQENVCIVLPLHLLKWTTYTNKAQCVFGLTPIEAIVELIMSSSLIESIEGKLSGSSSALTECIPEILYACNSIHTVILQTKAKSTSSHKPSFTCDLVSLFQRLEICLHSRPSPLHKFCLDNWFNASYWTRDLVSGELESDYHLLFLNSRTVQRLTHLDLPFAGFDLTKHSSRTTNENYAFRALCHILMHAVSLEHLNLRNNPLGVQGSHFLAKPLRIMPNLKHLDLSHTEIGDSGVANICLALIQNVSVCLTCLCLNSVGMRTSGSHSLFSLLSRQAMPLDVDIGSNSTHVLDLENLFVQLNGSNVCFKKLVLDRTLLNDAICARSLCSFLANSSLGLLEELSLVGCQVPTNQLSEICRMINDLPRLTILRLSSNYVSLSVESALADSLQKMHPSLTQIYLAHCGMNDCIKLAKSLHPRAPDGYTAQIELLDLTGNRLGWQSGVALGKMLAAQSSNTRCSKQFEKFRKDSFQCNPATHVHFETPQHRSDILNSGPCGLRVLLLGYNLLRDRGVKAVLSGLKTNRSLQVLNLDHNMAAFRSAAESGTMLANNDSLTTLSIAGNFLGVALPHNRPDSTGIKQFVRGLQNNSRLQHLDISDNQLGSTAERLFSSYGVPDSRLLSFDCNANRFAKTTMLMIQTKLKERIAQHIAPAEKSNSIHFSSNKIERDEDVHKMQAQHDPFRTAYRSSVNDICTKDSKSRESLNGYHNHMGVPPQNLAMFPSSQDELKPFSHEGIDRSKLQLPHGYPLQKTFEDVPKSKFYSQFAQMKDKVASIIETMPTTQVRDSPLNKNQPNEPLNQQNEKYCHGEKLSRSFDNLSTELLRHNQTHSPKLTHSLNIRAPVQADKTHKVVSPLSCFSQPCLEQKVDLFKESSFHEQKSDNVAFRHGNPHKYREEKRSSYNIEVFLQNREKECTEREQRLRSVENELKSITERLNSILASTFQ